MNRKSVVSRVSHLQYEQIKCAVPGGSDLPDEVKLMQCD